jgi:DNA-binding transcriptional LysR family regulator
VDRLEALKTFIEVAERRSFAETARTRRRSPAAISRTIAALEQDLGFTLLRRTTRQVTLTTEGAAYLEQCRPALAALDDAERAVRGESSKPHGVLVVSAPVVFGRMHVLPIVTELLRTHPELQIELMLTDRFARLVDEGIDIAVRIGDLTDSSLLAVSIGQTRRSLVASHAYVAERGMPKHITALREHDLIAFDTLAPNMEWRFGPKSRSAVRLEPRLLTNSVETAVDAAIAGLGITRAFCYQVSDNLAGGRLVEILGDYAPPPVPISLLFQANRQNSPNVRAFVQAAKSGLRHARLS